MTLVESVKAVYRAQIFPGRASRSEYWYWVLFQFLVIVGGGLIVGLVTEVTSLGRGNMDQSVGMLLMIPTVIIGVLLYAFAFINILFGFAVTVRRLHDQNLSGWWLLLTFIPLIGTIILLVWMCTRGTSGPNRFGSDPLALA